MFQLAFKVKHKLEKYEIYAIIGWLDPVFRNLAHGEVYESILDKPGFEMKNGIAPMEMMFQEPHILNRRPALLLSIWSRI